MQTIHRRVVRKLCERSSSHSHGLWIYQPWWHADWFDHWWSTHKEASRGTAWSWRRTNCGQSHRNTKCRRSKHALFAMKNLPSLDPKKTKNPKKPDSQKGKHCPRCDRDPHHDRNQGKGPALGSTCSYCKKPNHWLAVCNRRLRVHKIHIPKYSATLLHGLQPGWTRKNM